MQAMTKKKKNLCWVKTHLLNVKAPKQERHRLCIHLMVQDVGGCQLIQQLIRVCDLRNTGCKMGQSQIMRELIRSSCVF